jgi:RNA polymerase sigma-70 factor (ECF subfamily)
MSAKTDDPLLTLFLEYRDTLAGMVRRILRSYPEEEAEDVLQDVWILARKGWPPREPRFARSWLGKIAINTALRRLKSMKQSNRGRVTARAGADDPLEALASGAPSPEDRAVRREPLAVLRHAAASLSENCKKVVILRFDQDLTIKETARALGVPPGTVKSCGHRAIEHLRAALLAKAK